VHAAQQLNTCNSSNNSSRKYGAPCRDNRATVLARLRSAPQQQWKATQQELQRCQNCQICRCKQSSTHRHALQTIALPVQHSPDANCSHSMCLARLVLSSLRGVAGRSRAVLLPWHSPKYYLVIADSCDPGHSRQSHCHTATPTPALSVVIPHANMLQSRAPLECHGKQDIAAHLFAVAVCLASFFCRALCLQMSCLALRLLCLQCDE
jgi:hypothetical protein